MRFRFIAPILIIGVGLIISYLIVKNPLKNIEIVPSLASLSSKTPETTTKSNFQTPKVESLKNIKNLLKNLSLASSNTPDTDIAKNSSIDNQGQTSNNLTDDLAKTLAQKIAERNKEGLSQKDGEPGIVVPNEETVTQEWLEKNLAANKFGFDQPVIETKLKISQDNSPAAQIEYLRNIQKISRSRFGNFNKSAYDILSDVFEKNNLSSAQQATEIYKGLVNDYYNLLIPSSWLDFHKKAISHFQKAEAVYLAIVDFNNDPLKAYLAVETISQLETSAQENQTILENKIKALEIYS